MLLAIGLFALYASLTSFSALWPFMVELAGVDSASYGSFLGAGNLLSLLVQCLATATNSVGSVIFIGASFSIAASAALLSGYTYYSILSSTIFQRLGMAISMMGRGLAAGMEIPKSWKGFFTAGMLSSAQLGVLIGINLGLALFLLTGSYQYALVCGIILALTSMVLLAPWRRMKLFQENFSLKLLIPRRRAIQSLMLICLVDAFVWGGVFGFAYVLAPSYLGAVESDIGLARTLTMSVSIPMNLVFGMLSDKIRSRKLFMVLSEIIGSIAMMCYALIRSPISIMIFGLLMGFVASTWGPVVIAFFAEITPRRELGATLSSWSILTGISRVISPIIGGFIIISYGIPFFFKLSSVLILLVAVLIIFALKDRPSREIAK